MNKVQKKRLYNGLMAVAIVVIVVGVVLGVGTFQGWFGQGAASAGQSSPEAVTYEDNDVVAQNKVGNVNIERAGIAYQLNDGDKLKDGDIVQVLGGSSIDICYGEVTDHLTAGQEVVVHIGEDHKVSLEYLNNGEGEQGEGDSTSGASPNETKAVTLEGAQGAGGAGNPVCTITINCSTILDNMQSLTPGKSQYVPANGVILATSSVAFNQGETVFDILKRVCSAAGIQLEYSWTPLYNSYYVEGINNLYEFDCGNESGWMYQVNGWYPNYGCSSYEVKDGDSIVWNYTCNGYGADLGAPMN